AYPPVIPNIGICLAVAILIGYLAKDKGRSSSRWEFTRGKPTPRLQAADIAPNKIGLCPKSPM
ncbi:MAG: hypothetical protein NZ744_02540, partial [Pirellulaceae bacterium]|nr:hypothetical protein [Pirellulaceae bacterium]